jgi:[acyl-carrier-protein] S-malonyltransferase
LELRDPRVRIIANATSTPLTTAAAVKTELMNQLCSCVQWSRSVKTMANAGVSQFIEFGPGKVLTGLVKRISRGATALNVADLDSIEKAAK